MTTQKIEGKEIRFWDFDAPQYKTDEKGEPVEAPKLDAEGKPVLDAEGKPVLEKVQIGRGNWVRKPVDIEIDVPETTEEIAERFSSDDLVSIFAEGLKARAMREQGTAPSGTFSKAMVSAAVKGLKALPQFAALKRAQLNEAVMRFIGSNEATKKVFLDSYESLRGAEPEDNDDDEKA